MNIPKILIFKKDINIDLNVSQLETLSRFEMFLNKDRHINGKIQSNEFAFVHHNIRPKLYGWALIIFKGNITVDENFSKLTIKARLTDTFVWFYLSPGLIIPIGYLLNIDGMFDILKKILGLNVVPFLMPIICYFVSFFYYAMKISDVNNLLVRFKSEFER